jgi:cobalt-zinc-cadmium efflux system outer membrane protein
MRVNQAFARFTDDIYRLFIEGHLKVGTVATHDPAALSAQAFSARLAYKQSIQAYIYAWNQLVAAIGLRHLALTEVAGRIDASIPYFDYDTVQSHVLRNHTDVLTAMNGIDKARYNLKLAQVTPIPDVDFNVSLLKEYSLQPKQFVHTATIGFPFPIWDRNRGGIISAQGALGRALEEPHRVEENLTTTLAMAYSSYKQNLDALEDYRRYILPNQVTYYRGVIVRRDIDNTAQFGDVVTAQQALATSISNYLTTLGSLWMSVVSVADLLQTDDLFQLGQPRAVPALPDLNALPAWPCCHECPPSGGGLHGGSCISTPASAGKPAPVNVSTSRIGVAGPEQDVKRVKTTTMPFEDSGRATHADSGRATHADSERGTQVDSERTNLPTKVVTPTKAETLSAPSSKREEVPMENEVNRTLPRRLPSLKIRQTPDANDPLLLEQPPSVPAVSGKQEPEI